ncbi:MAG TPA: Ig-like domain-containing protein, partial [Spirochaetota bacterium]|nr:Ig-like domain-containing protein [Spirochaetota bacterium]
MKKILALAAFLVFITSCGGGTIGDAQEFEPNEPPSIIDVKAVSLNGSSTDSLKAGMKFTITVKAHDPENKKLKFQFNSDYGTFGNPVNTDDSCTIPFVTGSFVRPGLPVTVAVSVVDHKDASAATNYEIGKGRRGPTVTVRYEGSAYIQKEKNTRISFKADCEGIYQLYCDNGVDESSAGLRPASDYFLYRKDENGNFKDIIVDIAGPASSTEAKVKLSTPEFRNKVWVVFSDGINDPFAALAPVTVDNTPPQINIIDTSGTTGVGLRSPLRLVFDEEIMPSSVSDSSVKLEDNGSFFSLLKPNPSGKCSVEGNIVTFVPDGLEYYSNYKVSGRSGIKDLAGNEYTGSTNGTFTTVEKGTTPKPYFSKAADTYNDAQTVNIFVSDPDTKIFYTTAIGSAEADTPTPESNEYAGTAVNAEVNTSIKAVAVTRGYKQSSVASVKIKIRTPMPEFQLSTCQPYPVQSFAESKLVYPSGGVNYATIDIANAYPSGTEIKYNQSDSVGNWDNTLSTPDDPKTTSSSDWIQMTKNPGAYRYAVYAKSPNMEPSETVYSKIFRVRGLNLPSSLLSVNVYLENKKWKAVSCSSSGQYVAAIEGNPNGYIWVSDDYGVTWMQSKAGLKNWNSCYVSKTDPSLSDQGTDGKYMTATRGGNVCRSINYGMDWTFPDGGLNIRNAVYFDTTKYWIAYGGLNKINGNNSQEITDSALEAFSADGSIVFYSLASETKLKYWQSNPPEDIDFVGGGNTVNEWKDLAISGNGTRTAAIAYNGSINFLCYGNLLQISPITVVSGADFRDIAVSYDGKYIAACVMDGKVYRNKT